MGMDKNSDRSFSERRQHLRIYRHFIMSYHEKGKSIIRHGASQVNNISKGGLNFSSTYALTEGTVILIDLKTPFADSVHLEGTILECKEKIRDVIYEVRLQFKDIAPQALAVLEKIEGYGKAKGN
jgi:hypothetical protein